MILDECFTDAFIVSKAGEDLEKKRIYEKVIYAFYLLEKLAVSGIDFTFKGGTSLMLLLKEFSRFSVDIDLMMKSDLLTKVTDKILKLSDHRFVKVEEDRRKPTEVVKRHYKFFFQSIYQPKDNEDLPFVLLDIVFDNLVYERSKKIKIDSRFVKTDNPYADVSVPSVDEMLGDKLTAFAPKTIGILYPQPTDKYSKHIEIIKQLYDVSKLFDCMEDIDVVRSTYTKVAEIQIKNRKLNLTFKETLKDTIEACKLILTQNKKNRADEEYRQIKRGYEGFKHYTTNEFRFTELQIIAAKAYILAVKVLFDDASVEEEKPIHSFLGKDYKLVKQNIGEQLYSTLMNACFIENHSIQMNTQSS